MNKYAHLRCASMLASALGLAVFATGPALAVQPVDDKLFGGTDVGPV